MLAWNFGNQRIGPLNATLFINFMPVMTFGFRSLQGYQFSKVELLGAGLVVAALVANNVYLRVAYVAARRRAAVVAG
jgi:drug/metabolite transporter (DMT)-like permease